MYIVFLLCRNIRMCSFTSWICARKRNSKEYIDMDFGLLKLQRYRNRASTIYCTQEIWALTRDNAGGCCEGIAVSFKLLRIFHRVRAEYLQLSNLPLNISDEHQVAFDLKKSINPNSPVLIINECHKTKVSIKI